MSPDSQLDADRFRPEPPERKRSALSTCLMGCLIVFVVLLILGAIAGYVIWQNWRNWTAGFGSQMIKQGIEQSQLPGEEKQEIGVQVDRIAEAFRNGQLSMEQLKEIFRRLVDSPLMTSIAASAIEAEYLAKSGLNDGEKIEAKQTLRRFLRGSIDHKIDEQTLNSIMAHVADRQPNGSWKLKQQISDEELRKFLEEAKAAADKAGIPDEPEDFDPSDEIKRIADEALQK